MKVSRKALEAVLKAASSPRHDYCVESWLKVLDEAVYRETTSYGDQYRDKAAISKEDHT